MDRERAGIAAILLAAGRSRRMRGTDKLLARVGGRPLVRRAAESLAASVDPLLLVVGPDSSDLSAALEGVLHTRVVHPGAAEGMGSSLAAGVRALPPGTGGVLVALADMPFVRPETVAFLVRAAAAAPERILRPVHHGRPGHPVLWPAWSFPALAELQGDQGARGLLQVHEDAVDLIPIADPGVVQDIDTPAALARARSRDSGRSPDPAS